MGLLDDLEQEAQRRKASLDEVERLKAEREQAYRTQLEPGMQALHEYLAKLVANLAFLKPKLRIQHDVAGYGPVVANIEHEYDLKANRISPASREITLNYFATVATEDCQPVVVQGAGKIRTLNGIFQKLRLSGIAEAKKDDSGELVQATFRPRGKIPLAVQVNADAESAVVRMAFTNFDTLGTVTKTVAPAQFGDALFDEIGRFLAREPSTLFREALPDDYRKQLQHRIQQEQLKRKWESKIAEQQREELERLKREQGLKAALDRTVKGVKDKAPSLVERVKGIFRKS